MALQTVTAEIEVTATIEGRGEWDEDSRGRFYAYEPHTWADLTIDIAGATVKLSELPDALKYAIWNSVVDDVEDERWEVQE